VRGADAPGRRRRAFRSAQAAAEKLSLTVSLSLRLADQHKAEKNFVSNDLNSLSLRPIRVCK
jgi:hypothetical protein